MIHRHSVLVVCALLAAGGVAAAQGRSNGIELRIASASNAGGGLGLFGLVLAPGVTYDTEGENFVFNLTAGAGYFVSPAVVVGADLGITVFELGGGLSDESLKIYSLVPYLKYVTGVSERRTGFFVEPSLGISVIDVEESATLLQLGVWGGGHFMFSGASVALLVGPYVTYLKNTDSDVGDDDNVLIGLKFGLSAYLL